MKDVHELEVYTPIDGFPNYLVTSKGRVLSLKDNKGKRRIKELKLNNGSNGYLFVNLYNNRKRHFNNVHRLVAQAFIPNPENKPQVNHIDEDKTNNHVSNLEWVTSKENINHGTKIVRTALSNKGKKRTDEIKQKMSEHRKGKTNGINHYKSKSVIGFKINGCDIKYYKYINECEKDGFHHSDIINCCKGKLKTAKGYKWYYTDEFFNKNK